MPHFFFIFDSISWCSVGKSEIRRVCVISGVSENFRVSGFWLEIHVVGVWVMFGLLSLLMHTWCEWFLGQELTPSCKSTSPIKPHLSFLPRSSRTSPQGLTSEIISSTLSRMLLVDQLFFVHHPLLG